MAFYYLLRCSKCGHQTWYTADISHLVSCNGFRRCKGKTVKARTLECVAMARRGERSYIDELPETPSYG